MPSTDRVYPVRTGDGRVVAGTGHVLEASGAEASGAQASAAAAAVALRRAVEVLTGSDLAQVVDLVAWIEDGWLHAANADGASRLPTGDPDGAWEVVRGRDPVAVQDPLHGVPLAAALADPSPPSARNSYPFAGRRLLSVFADPTRSPDVVVVHTPRHYWPERGGHLGEHGSLDAGQSRAPLILSGAGVTARGLLPRAARVVDIGPTLAMLAGAEMPRAEGAPLADLAEPGARHVVGLLWDGTNCNDLLDLASRGELPNVARLLARGVALTGGAVAEFPSVTLTNHTSALTGLGPGRHGILHNVYFDRATGRQVITNDAASWHAACDQLRDGVLTVFEAVASSRPGAATACVNEPIDRGADYSTFGLVRALGVTSGTAEGGDSGAAGGAGGGRMDDYLPSAQDDPHASPDWVAADRDYAWSTRVDALGLNQVVDLWSEGQEPPALTWWNTTITDTGHHGGGAFSPEARAALADADRRLGVFLDLVDRRGFTDSTAILLTADHGFETADPDCRGDWDAVLREQGLRFRDEGYGFIYLDVPAPAEPPTGAAPDGEPERDGSAVDLLPPQPAGS